MARKGGKMMIYESQILGLTLYVEINLNKKSCLGSKTTKDQNKETETSFMVLFHPKVILKLSDHSATHFEKSWCAFDFSSILLGNNSRKL